MRLKKLPFKIQGSSQLTCISSCQCPSCLVLSSSISRMWGHLGQALYAWIYKKPLLVGMVHFICRFQSWQRKCSCCCLLLSIRNMTWNPKLEDTTFLKEPSFPTYFIEKTLFPRSHELLDNCSVTVGVLCHVVSVVFVILENTLADWQTKKLVGLLRGCFILQPLGTWDK